MDLLHPSDLPNSLGRYAGFEITGVIGAGGMGVVLKGLDIALQRTVALKILAPHFANSALARRYFVREGQAAASILHPNVVSIHQVSEVESLPVIVMPYLGSETLQSRIDELGWLPLDSILRISRQLAAALAAAHDQGVIHRDIKPANILLERHSERIVVTDFGLARVADSTPGGLTELAAGTPSYMSPEQARGETVDCRSDLFSLGSVMYAMCTGHAPFRAENSFSILRLVTDGQPPPVLDRNPDVPRWLLTLIDWLHHKQPENRPENAQVVADLLDQCLKHYQAPSREPLPVELVERPRALRRNWLYLVASRRSVIGIVGGAMFAIIGWLALTASRPTLPREFGLVLPPQLMSTAFRDSDQTMSVNDMLKRFKEAEPHSAHEVETIDRLLQKFQEHLAGADGEPQRAAVRQAWANELLPLVIGDLTLHKAKCLEEFCKPSAQARENDRLSWRGQLTPPLDWEVQVVSAFVAARRGFVDDAKREIETVVHKARVYAAASSHPDAALEFQGKPQRLQSIIDQLEFYRKIIEGLAIQTMGQEPGNQ
jgi:serine/threonine protein kinase